jgi:putative SOS response-associated peptidase YedK
VQSAAIITREAVGILAPIHHRMPVILPKDLWSTWLSSKSLSPNEIDDYLNMIDIKEADKDLIFWPVSDDVNNARNTGADLAKEIALGEPGTLF